MDVSNRVKQLSLSKTYAEKRIQKATMLLGPKIVTRVIGFALFLMGAKREDIATLLGIPYGTFLSLLTRIDKKGPVALVGQKNIAPSWLEKKQAASKCTLTVEEEEQHIQIRLGQGQAINILKKNSLQLKVVLLTFLNNGMLSTKVVSEVLHYSSQHTRNLNAMLENQDAQSLLEKRKGHQTDYRCTPEVKAELIQQFAINVITGRPTSSRIISEDIKQRCNIELSARSIRTHVEKLGLRKISQSLPENIEALKKKSI